MQSASAFIDRLGAVMWKGGLPATARQSTGFDAIVDGVRISVRERGRGVRLETILAAALPDDETTVRRLLASFLPHTDHGSDVLCTDPSGAVCLISDVQPDQDAEQIMTHFANAAIHWAGRLSNMATPAAFKTPSASPMILYP